MIIIIHLTIISIISTVWAQADQDYCKFSPKHTMCQYQVSAEMDASQLFTVMTFTKLVALASSVIGFSRPGKNMKNFHLNTYLLLPHKEI